MKKLTIEDLLERKQKLAAKPRTKEVESPVLGGSIVIERAPLRTVLGLVDEAGADLGTYEAAIMMMRLIYETCPIFRNPELLEAFKVDADASEQAAFDEIEEPFEIVGVLLDENIGEITRLGLEVMDFHGIGEENIVEDIKN